jgi:hypothetical protein
MRETHRSNRWHILDRSVQSTRLAEYETERNEQRDRRSDVTRGVHTGIVDSVGLEACVSVGPDVILRMYREHP